MIAQFFDCTKNCLNRIFQLTEFYGICISIGYYLKKNSQLAKMGRGQWTATHICLMVKRCPLSLMLTALHDRDWQKVSDAFLTTLMEKKNTGKNSCFLHTIPLSFHFFFYIKTAIDKPKEALQRKKGFVFYLERKYSIKEIAVWMEQGPSQDAAYKDSSPSTPWLHSFPTWG